MELMRSTVSHHYSKEKNSWPFVFRRFSFSSLADRSPRRGGDHGRRTATGRWTATGSGLDRALSTAGSPTVVVLRYRVDRYRPKPVGVPSFRLVQPAGEGRYPTDVVSSSATLFAGSDFDAARPFGIEVRLPAGRHFLFKELLVGVPRESQDR